MPFRFTGIDHVQLAAPNGCEPKARQFFGHLLGWQEIEKPEPLRSRGGLWFRCGTHQIHIGVQEPFAPATKAHPAFDVVDLQALKSHLMAHDVPITEDSARSDEHITRFYAHDPFGNRLEFMERHAADTGES
jgi:catechol 2,3-dioxygenase-like lactoylglutathione lyase family enzyme